MFTIWLSPSDCYDRVRIKNSALAFGQVKETLVVFIHRWWRDTPGPSLTSPDSPCPPPLVLQLMRSKVKTKTREHTMADIMFWITAATSPASGVRCPSWSLRLGRIHTTYPNVDDRILHKGAAATAEQVLIVPFITERENRGNIKPIMQHWLCTLVTTACAVFLCVQ